jgi:hypothetical protein
MTTDFPDLALGYRAHLFEALSSIDPLEPLMACTFGGRPGWLMTDMRLARPFLTSTPGRKSRPDDSQRLLGGVGTLSGGHVRTAKRQLIVALGREAADRDRVRAHLTDALADLDGRPSVERLTEALSSALLGQATGHGAMAVDGARLRRVVNESWRRLERPRDPASLPDDGTDDDLATLVLDLIRTGRSAFLDVLTGFAWSHQRIAEELRALILAGWGSTTALTLSALGLGVSRSPSRPVMDEVLRLFPPSFMIARTVTHASVPWPFQKSDVVVVSPWLVQRSPKGWTSPEQFDPERWARSSPPHWYLPFGLGPRRCPAATFARVQAAEAVRQLSTANGPGEVHLGMVEGRSPALLPGSGSMHTTVAAGPAGHRAE